MERTAVSLGGIRIGSSIMNASGARSAERLEILELASAHHGALVFKSCNVLGLDTPENLRNRGAAHFAAIARELAAQGKPTIGSVVGITEEEIITVAQTLDRAGVSIVELNLADDFVTKAVAPFASFERLKALLGRVRGEIGAVMAVKLPQTIDRSQTRPIAELFKSLRIAIAVCWNDLPKDLEVDISRGIAKGPQRILSQVHAFYRESDGLLEVVAVGGVASGREAYLGHLTGAKAIQVGSALMKEGVGALNRIDQELDSILAESHKPTLTDIVGSLGFEA